MNELAIQLDHDRQSFILADETYSKQDYLWDQLTLAQEFSVCSLGQFGYVLSDFRDRETGKVAVLMQGKKMATICENGYINTNAKHFN